jgi:hypothetical protein
MSSSNQTYFVGIQILQYKASANFIGSVLIDILGKLSEKHLNAAELRIQIDGGPDNLNQTIICLIGVLVACKVFDKIHFARLPVG